MIDMLKKEKKKKDAEIVFDFCVCCGETTGYKSDVSIDERIGYIEGTGQLCLNCYRELYPKGISGDD